MDRGRERGSKDSVKERVYTGKGIFNVAGSGRSWENQTILGNTSPSKTERQRRGNYLKSCGNRD